MIRFYNERLVLLNDIEITIADEQILKGGVYGIV